MIISKMQIRGIWILLALSVSLATLAVAPSSQAAEYGSQYFPRVGKKSFAEEIRELRNPAVVLVIATNPGTEDLPAIAYWRIGIGAKVEVAFVTNGEDLPGDLSGESFYELAARRKEEAYQALSYLGVGSYFLNVPQTYLRGQRFGLARRPAEDSVLASRLDSVIDKVEPDVVVLDRDPLYGNSASPREELLQEIVLATVRRNRRSGGWLVSRVVKESVGREGGTRVPVGTKDHIWSQSYKDMALKAAKRYPSLRFQISLWNKDRSHRYLMIFPAVHNAPVGLTEGLPLVVRGLRTVLPYIKRVSLLASHSSFRTRLGIVREAILHTDSYIGRHENSLGRRGMRVAAHWTNGLEKLRSTILGVNVHYSVSDTVLASVQLFFLRFGKIQTRIGNAGLKILFPGVLRKQWIVNDEQQQNYPLHENDTFRVLTPKLKLNSTGSPTGFMAARMRHPFRFVVARRSENPDSDFVFNAEVPLIIAPIRSIQVLTPQVAALRDSVVRVRLKSNSRDSASGRIYIKGPLVNAAPARVDLRGKGYVQHLSLRLHWKDTVLTGVRKVELLANRGQPIGAFYAHYIQVKANPRGKVAIYSLIKNTPLELALARLGINAVDLGSTVSRGSGALSDYSTIVVDRFSYDSFLKKAHKLGNLEQWVKNGGTLIILPQFGMRVKGIGKNSGCGFSYLPVTRARAELKLDSESPVFYAPNKVSGSGLAEGQFPVAFGILTGLRPDESKILVETREHIPLVAEQQAGRGRIFYCALNLYPRIDALYPGTYRLLANMVSRSAR